MPRPDAVGRFLKGIPPHSIAVLCGAGVSYPSGLPTARPFIEGVLRHLSADTRSLDLLQARSGNEGGDVAALRFEGLLSVLQRVVDPDLDVLSVYGGGVPNPNHYCLAALARKGVAVLTTNGDSLIEQVDSRLKVKFKSDHFRLRQSSSRPALWKLHGTLSAVDSGTQTFRRLKPEEEGSLVFTLGTISQVRHDPRKRKFFDAILYQRRLVVIGYSAADDFDISRWLADACLRNPVLWIQHSVSETQFSFKEAKELPAGRHPGLSRLLAHWVRSGADLSKSSLVLTETLSALRQVAAQLRIVLPDKAEGVRPLPSADLASFLERWARGSLPDRWHKLMMTGALLSHLGLPALGQQYLEGAVKLAANGGQRVKALVLLAEAGLAVGDRASVTTSARNSETAIQLAAGLGATHRPWIRWAQLVRAKSASMLSELLEMCGVDGQR